MQIYWYKLYSFSVYYKLYNYYTIIIIAYAHSHYHHCHYTLQKGTKYKCSHINYLTHREKPLTLYIFSQEKGIISMIINNTSSGNVLVNDVILHATGIFTYGCVVKSSYIFCLNFGLFLYDANTIFFLTLMLCINCNFLEIILHNI